MPDDGEHPREAARIRCLECGRWFRALPTHLLRKHGLEDDDYRLKHGIKATSPLVCLEWSERASRFAVDTEIASNSIARGPKPGYRQRESVRVRRGGDYATLAALGSAAAAELDRTEARRKLLAPYPVTAEQAADRLGCTKTAAYTFLSWCVRHGKLRRLGRGLYDAPSQESDG